MLPKLLVILLYILALLNKLIEVFSLHSPLSADFKSRQWVLFAVYPVTHSVYRDLKHLGYFLSRQTGFFHSPSAFCHYYTMGHKIRPCPCSSFLCQLYYI
jgi:hypothetical protein